jgi:hypothetical protein
MAASLNKLQTSAYKENAVIVSDITRARTLVAGNTNSACRWTSEQYSLPSAVVIFTDYIHFGELLQILTSYYFI